MTNNSLKQKNYILNILQKLKITNRVFYGKLPDLIDLSNLFKFCKIITHTEKDEQLQQSLEIIDTLVITEKASLVLSNLHMQNHFFLCEEKYSKFFHINRKILLEICIEYFKLNLSSNDKQNILSIKTKESIYSITFKIYANSGVFNKVLVNPSNITYDTVSFFFQKYYEYKNKNNTLTHICEKLYENFFITGNKSLAAYFLLLEQIYKNNTK